MSLKTQSTMPASSRIDKQRFAANVLPESDSRNAIMYFENGRFCLTPLSGSYWLGGYLSLLETWQYFLFVFSVVLGFFVISLVF